VPRLYRENLIAAGVVFLVAYLLEWGFPREISLCRVKPTDRVFMINEVCLFLFFCPF